jgi:hypothetical protein
MQDSYRVGQAADIDDLCADLAKRVEHEHGSTIMYDAAPLLKDLLAQHGLIRTESAPQVYSRAGAEPKTANDEVQVNSAGRTGGRSPDGSRLSSPLTPTTEPLGDKTKALEALDGLTDVVENSYGVVGWHRNGDVASWDDLGIPEHIADIRAYFDIHEGNPLAPVHQTTEWFYRWAARAMAGNCSAETAMSVIFNCPNNPYAENNPWKTETEEAVPPQSDVMLALENAPDITSSINYTYSWVRKHLDTINAALKAVAANRE